MRRIFPRWAIVNSYCRFLRVFLRNCNNIFSQSDEPRIKAIFIRKIDFNIASIGSKFLSEFISIGLNSGDIRHD